MALGYSCTVTVKPLLAGTLTLHQPLLAGTLTLQCFVLALNNIRKAQITLCPAPTGSDSSPCCSLSRRSTSLRRHHNLWLIFMCCSCLCIALLMCTCTCMSLTQCTHIYACMYRSTDACQSQLCATSTANKIITGICVLALLTTSADSSSLSTLGRMCDVIVLVGQYYIPFPMMNSTPLVARHFPQQSC